MKAAIAIFGVLAFVLVMLFFGWIGFSNDANGYEVTITATYNNNKNVYDNGWKKVKEMAQVPDMQTEALMKQYDAAIKARYGSEGSKALFQFIQEQNPQMNQETFLKLQRAIEGFHDDFQANQTKLVSVKQSYGSFLVTNATSRFYNQFSHYPHIRCGVPDGSPDDYAILTSDKTETEFKNHKADELKLK